MHVFFNCSRWSFTNHQALQKCFGTTEVIGKAKQTAMDDQYQWWRSAKAGKHWCSVKTRSYIIISGVIITGFITCYCENFNYISKNTACTKSYSSQFLLQPELALAARILSH